MNLEKITSGDELVSLFPDKFNSNMDEIDSAVGDNTSDISALDTRLTTAEGDIDALETGLAQFSNVLSGAAACGLTAQEGVTIGSCYKLKIGRLVTYQMQIALTSSASNLNLVTGFEAPLGTMNGITGMVRALNNNSQTVEYFLWLSETGVLRTLSVGSANLRFAITYITAS